MSVSLRLSCLLLLPFMLCWHAPALAEEQAAPRYGITLLAVQSYDPDRFGLVILQGNVQLPYAQVFWHDAPDSLFFKGELNVGITTDGRERGLVAANMMAVKYIEFLFSTTSKPYLEGGIGVAFTDFRVKGQGLRINFNPQIGVGIDFPTDSGRDITMGVRLHHLSNGDLHRDNRGINSILLVSGVRF